MPSWKELKRFCDREYELIKEGADHWYYRKVNPDGSPQIIKVSRGTGEIGKALLNRILKHQLGVTKEYFNSRI
jgi:hypothetical protein